ncbi:6-hydroxymethylpterin diphosphokinase MptE-like protein [Ekhidna sp.]|uniref:6-hydroxymethylpterin diphosphokinase MptE-like protein n=1 Tax=Ekhidna sp. TaxID=2608089 RepID=UPI003B5128F1
MKLKYGSIKFSPFQFPMWLFRSLITKYMFFDYPGISFQKDGRKSFRHLDGYQTKLEKYYNKHKGQRCFLLGNGPSLRQMDLSNLKNEIIIGANGIYKEFDNLGFKTNYLFFEDTEQTFLRRKDINSLTEITKLVGLNNAYYIKRSTDTVFFNPRHGFDLEGSPKFSREFASGVFLGATISYIMLQWAYFLGFSEVYVLGIDHNYGELPKLFPPGKIEITEQNIHKVRGLHFSDHYYKIGDVIGVPHVDIQNKAYEKANEVFQSTGRKVYNAGVNSKLEAFEKIEFNSLFTNKT